MCARRLKPLRTNDPFSNLEDFDTNDQDATYVEPESWTIITALDRVLSLAKGSQLSDEFFEKCKNPLTFLRDKLELTDVQIIVIAILIEAGESLSWRGLGKYLGLSRLRMMTYTDDIEGLVAKRWISHAAAHDSMGCFKGFKLIKGVVLALRHNKPFIPERIDNLDIQSFVDKISKHLRQTDSSDPIDFKDDEEWIVRLVKANTHLPICQEMLKFEDVNSMSFFSWLIFDYAQCGNDNEGLSLQFIDNYYPEEWECEYLRQKLKDGTHQLFKRGLIEHQCENGIVKPEEYVLSSNAKNTLLAGYTHRSLPKNVNVDNNLKKHGQIKEKSLFFNDTEKEQLDRLSNLLTKDNLPSVQQRLEEQGLRKGFACLFYGAPGTGKTESVLQIARQTGRDIMQIDIAGLRDKWVGESEKNIKAVFARYRNVCENSDVMPILFFNEADAIFGRRNENAEHSVDKMNNAMQNIILQEIEDLDGILIATTNLTTNLDSAFERRFLFKVEFHKPNIEIKAKIWKSMINDLSIDDAHRLASKYDFSGGQIENIARKRTIDYILSGKEATLSDLEKYCEAELFESKNNRIRITGFSL